MNNPKELEKLREEWRKLRDEDYEYMSSHQISNWWLKKIQERDKLLVERIENKAVDKAEILKNKGYGNPPILFEKSEIIAIINNIEPK